ncbi:RluA family pseudouridine synthase [bacterium]|nr:RluA family pseudouridine synthase [bacterium]NBW57172.1 RluA family pseudouridine synthase [bacterium]NBX71744.1 RluA family pseudouridine synthase [bacterium]
MSNSYHTEIIPDADHAGQRVDNYILSKTKLPRPLIYKALRHRDIRVNKKKVGPSYRLVENDVIQIPKHYLTPIQESKPAPKNISWIQDCIFFEHPDFYVINKPNGLAVHGGSGDSFGLIELLRLHFNNSKLELIHRLDKETSGLILIAKKRSALTAISTLFAERTIQKTYLALLNGICRKKTLVQEPLRIDRIHGIRQATVARDGQAATTTFIPLFKQNQQTLCAVLPKTGRMHQIRAHALFLGMPIVGDKLYGHDETNKLHLHATKLEFTYQDELYTFEQEPPSFWDAALFNGWNLWKTINQHQN